MSLVKRSPADWLSQEVRRRAATVGRFDTRVKEFEGSGSRKVQEEVIPGTGIVGPDCK